MWFLKKIYNITYNVVKGLNLSFIQILDLVVKSIIEEGRIGVIVLRVCNRENVVCGKRCKLNVRFFDR